MVERFKKVRKTRHKFVECNIQRWWNGVSLRQGYIHSTSITCIINQNCFENVDLLLQTNEQRILANLNIVL